MLTRPEAATRADWIAVGLALAGPGGALSGWDALRRRALVGPDHPGSPALVLARTGGNPLIGQVRIRGSPFELNVEIVDERRGTTGSPQSD